MTPDSGRAARRPPLLVWGAGVVGAIAIIALAAPLLAPYDPVEQTDPVAGRHRPPGTALHAVRLDNENWLLADAVETGPATVRLLRLGRWQELPRSRVTNLVGEGVADRRVFVLGSDRFGRDLLSRVLFGARVSLTIGLLAAALALTLGLVVGGAAGVAGGWIDSLLMRIVDAILCFPRIFLLLAVSALFDVSGGVLVLVLGCTSWMGASRLVRAEIRAARRREFVTAAHSAGLPPARILLRHLLPVSLTPVIVDTTLRVANLILVEAALSYLGFGVQAPHPSWGNMVAEGRDSLLSAWWVPAFPGSVLAITVIGLNMLGDGLRDRFDPRAGRRAGGGPGPENG